MALYQQCALHLEMLAGFQENTNHRDNTSMSSMASVYSRGDFGKQIYTMHSTTVDTPGYTHQHVGCDKEQLETKFETAVPVNMDW